MKVKELIEVLNQFDSEEEIKVQIPDPGCGCCSFGDIICTVDGIEKLKNGKSIITYDLDDGEITDIYES